MAQDLSNKRSKWWVVTSDTLQLDTMSIVPQTLRIQDKKLNYIDVKSYSIDYLKSKLILHQPELYDSLLISYRVLPISFFKPTTVKKNIDIDTNAVFVIKPIYEEKNQYELFNLKGLDYAGTYTRGLSVGNVQNLSMNSNFNLQLSGMLQDVKITAALTDNNLPFQPEGNTQTIQEFDRIFFQLQRKNTILSLGDLENKSNSENYFLRFTKKIQGFDFYTFNEWNKNTKLENQFNFAIPRGKYFRYNLPVQEGNQGPYKLVGENGELYIIIIAGSESVFIDGEKLQRGEDRDYIIDYNLGEIKFTTKVMIKRETRIVVDYQYTNRNYSRTILTSYHNFQFKKIKAGVSYYREHDNKNQPIDQDLGYNKVRTLENIGDQVENAYAKTIDSTGFSTERINYILKDTLIDGSLYDSILVYSTNSMTAHYQANFIYVGFGKGNYNKDANNANGNVYEWIAPIAGILQGEFEPVQLLVAPQSHQIISTQINYDNGHGRKTKLENAWSFFDKNTFSSLQDADNTKTALFFSHQELFHLSKNKNWYIQPQVGFIHSQENFQEVESFRNVEFARDWNLSPTLARIQQNLSSAGFELHYKPLNYFQFKTENLNSKTLDYQGWRENFALQIQEKKILTQMKSSFLLSQDSNYRYQFIRPEAHIAYNLNKKITIGTRYNQENNLIRQRETDSLTANTFSFIANSLYFNFKTNKWQSTSELKQRLDKNMMANELKKASQSLELIQKIDWTNKYLQVQSNVHYRRFAVLDTLFTQLKNKNSVLGNLNINAKILKNFINSQSSYQINNGQEQRVEYRFIKVNAGQGQYVWMDSLFNNDGIPEVNEFLIPPTDFQYQADYIRILVPTNSYIQVTQVQFNQSLYIEPKNIFTNKNKKINKWINVWSDQFSLQYNSRSADENNWRAFVPFAINISDTTTKSQFIQLRNSLFWNASHNKYSAEYMRLYSRDQTQLYTGQESKLSQSHVLRARYNIKSNINLITELSTGNKSYNSSAWDDRNYFIILHDLKLSSNFLFKNKIKLSFNYHLSDRKNYIQYGGETALQNKFQFKYRHNFTDKGSIQTEFSFVQMEYQGSRNSPISYTILEGLQKGSNFLWTIGIDRRLLKNLVLNITYDGRKTGTNRIVHIGRMQVSAIF